MRKLHFISLSSEIESAWLKWLLHYTVQRECYPRTTGEIWKPRSKFSVKEQTVTWFNQTKMVSVSIMTQFFRYQTRKRVFFVKDSCAIMQYLESNTSSCCSNLSVYTIPGCFFYIYQFML